MLNIDGHPSQKYLHMIAGEYASYEQIGKSPCCDHYFWVNTEFKGNKNSELDLIAKRTSGKVVGSVVIVSHEQHLSNLARIDLDYNLIKF